MCVLTTSTFGLSRARPVSAYNLDSTTVRASHPVYGSPSNKTLRARAERSEKQFSIETITLKRSSTIESYQRGSVHARACDERQRSFTFFSPTTKKEETIDRRMRVRGSRLSWSSIVHGSRADRVLGPRYSTKAVSRLGRRAA